MSEYREGHTEDKEAQDFEFLSEVKKQQESMFGPVLRNEDYITSQAGAKHTYFSPVWHIKQGLVTREIVKQFSQDNTKTILSVGSGPAYLEQLLTKQGIDKERVTLSDINEEGMPEGFVSLKFDMLKRWPDELPKYDLIIFPESVRTNTQRDPGTAFEQLVQNAVEHLKDLGQIRMDGYSQKEDTVKKITRVIEETGGNVLASKNLLVISR